MAKRQTKKTAPATETAAVEIAQEPTAETLGQFYPGTASARSVDLVNPVSGGMTTDEDENGKTFDRTVPDWKTRCERRATVYFQDGVELKHRPAIACFVFRMDQAAIDTAQARLKAATDSDTVEVAGFSDRLATVQPSGKCRDGHKVLDFIQANVSGVSWTDQRAQAGENVRAEAVGRIGAAAVALGQDVGEWLETHAAAIDTAVETALATWEETHPNPAEAKAEKE